MSGGVRPITQTKPLVSLPDQNLSQKLGQLLFGGSSKSGGSYFQLLVTPAVDNTDTDLQQSFSFLAYIDWIAIFDFDANQKLYNFLEQDEKMQCHVKTFDDFERQLLSERGAVGGKRLRRLGDQLEDTDESLFKTWVFCNGRKKTAEKKFKLEKWKRERIRVYKEAVLFFRNSIPAGRAAVVILVSSHEEVFIEACKELILTFQEQWLVIAESKEHAEGWIEGLQMRNIKVDRERCLFDFSFAEISKTLFQLMRVETLQLKQSVIKSSPRAMFPIPDKKRMKLLDLDIVSEQEFNLADVDTGQLCDDQEDEFYKGNRATWWNFHFHHVCRRDKLDDLKRMTEKALGGGATEGENVRSLTFYHQPGAGGTTLAMNVIWDMRKTYNCCTVKTITDSTSDQILSLYKLGESDINKKATPVLVMVDNEDDFQLSDMVDDIRTKCLQKQIQNLVCVLLVCKRRTAVQQNDQQRSVFIEHKLSFNEKKFFTDKYEELKTKGRGNLDCLLGLNIMKEDFNKDYIQRTVSHFVNSIGSYHHKTILVYTALLNLFDLDFRGIPVSCFDPLLQHERKPGDRAGREGPWENKLTLEPLLIFITDCRLASRRKCLRVTHPLLSRYILDKLRPNCSNADLMKQFLHSNMFQGQYQDINFRALIVIVKDIIKKRGMDPEGKKRCKFSPFIQTLMDQQKMEEAVECVEIVFDRTRDAFIAQQIARIYIEGKDWDKAQEWADTAVEIVPDNSFLYDTCGQIYRRRLEELKYCGPDLELISQAVEYAFEGYRLFQKEEDLSKDEYAEPPNTAGLFGMLEIVWLLSNILKRLPGLSSDENIRKVLSGERQLPDELLRIREMRHCYVEWLKTLKKSSYACLAEAQRNKKMYVDGRRVTHTNTQVKFFLSEGNISLWRDRLNDIFGEEFVHDLDHTQSNLDTRQKQIRQLGGDWLLSVMNRCGRGETGKRKAVEIFQLSSLDLRQSDITEWPTYNLEMALASALTLIACHDGGLQQEEFSNILKWSAVYCQKPEIRSPNWGKFFSLDPYVFLLALHWPTPNRRSHEEQCDPAELNRVVALSQEGFVKLQDKTATWGIRKENNPIFFLTKQPHSVSVVSNDRLQTISRKKDRRLCTVLRSPAVLDLVHRFSGILLRDGKEVKMTVSGHQMKVDINIPLLTEENRQVLWNKTVFFALGIGLGGPLACDVEGEQPAGSSTVETPAVNYEQSHDAGDGAQLMGDETLQLKEYVIKLSSGDMFTIPDKKRMEMRDLNIVSEKECHLVDVDTGQLCDGQEDEFYKGNRATWWNFHFHHVCRRDKLDDLNRMTENALGGDATEGENVSSLTVYHQPGAGGTTLAMNVIWDMRKHFKCCTVKTITDSTSDQILSLYELGESDIKKKATPVLVMVDNEDDFQLSDMVDDIRTKCLQNEIQNLVCVLLVCKRRTAIQQNDQQRSVFLEHKLSLNEKKFFTDKYEELNTKGRGNLDCLLGLNIMKEDFNNDYIQRTVSHFVTSFDSYHHKSILVYTALLNLFDLDFRGIPVSCFDPLLQQDWKPGAPALRESPWENKLTLEPLLIFTTDRRLAGRRKCIRVTHRLLCRYILDKLRPNCSNADLMKQFLHSNMFQGQYQDINFRALIVIVKDIIKKREMDPEGKKRCKFSPFVQHLIDQQKMEEAVECVKIVFDRTRDAFIAQQIAKIYIEGKDWDKAQEWVDTAVEIVHDNPFLYDTCGQIYRRRLEETRNDCGLYSGFPDLGLISKAVMYAFEGHRVFQKEQELCKVGYAKPPNSTGLFGMLEIVWLLSKILKRLPDLSCDENIRKVLSGERQLPDELLRIREMQHCYVEWLKTLKKSSYACLAEAQRNKKMYVDGRRVTHTNTQEKMFMSEGNISRWRDRLNEIFGEEQSHDAGDGE